MKQLKDAFADSINRAEKTLNAKRGQPRPDTPKQCGHVVAKLSDARHKKRAAEARDIVQQVRKLGLDADTLAKIDAAADNHASNPEKWIFVMLSAQQNIDVIDWLQANSKRPHKAQKVWATLFTKLRMDTGEIMATRQELAERVRLAPKHLSSIMTELETINAIRREKDGRRVKYYLNPNIATHQGNAVARAKAREEAGPLMQVIEGGAVDDDMDVIDE